MNEPQMYLVRPKKTDSKGFIQHSEQAKLETQQTVLWLLKFGTRGRNQLQRKKTREFLGDGTVLCQDSGVRYTTLSNECTMKSEFYCMSFLKALYIQLNT